MKKPFYEEIRPQKLEDMVGQSHILGKNMLIPKLYQQNKVTNLIFYGPPGTGKTTLANILINNADMLSYRLNATYAKTQDIRDIVETQTGLLSEQSVVILLDEIHNFNKKQQQLLLEYIEKGKVVLIANTTENPYFHVYKSLLSRMQVVEFKSLSDEDILTGLKKTIHNYSSVSIEYEEEALRMIVSASNGDFRKSLSILGLMVELSEGQDSILLNREFVKNISSSKAIEYDRNSTSHYDLLSAFQKSIRGSDADASIHYLARLCYAEDLESIGRRLLVIACEDVGLAYPNAITIVKSCVDAAYMLGFPEARIPLAQATILLATAPKSNSAYMAINAAMQDLQELNITEIPKNILNAVSAQEKEGLGKGVGYLYPHDFPNSYVEQNYMPSAIKDRVYYHPKDNKYERATVEYFKKIKV
ncbi:MAG: replication-associated recombination protein A [Peptostreptococcaceae bacterium]|nr:replication-associated recombination protein A [Peptostreptococcaceae bacterium]